MDVLYIICYLKFKNNHQTLNVKAEIRYGNAMSKGGFDICFKISDYNFPYDKWEIKSFDSSRIIFDDFSLPKHNKLGECQEVAYYIIDLKRDMARKHKGFRLCRTCSHGVVTDLQEIIVIQNNYPKFLESCNCGRFRSREVEKDYKPPQNSDVWI